MLSLQPFRAASVALANWAGLAGRDDQPVARILMYHGTPRRGAGAFERELRWLKRRFQVVPLRSVVAATADGGTLGAKVALTFDDGLRSNVDVAYPILQRLGLPATFFICPGLVDRARWLWTHEVRRRLARLPAGARAELAAEWRSPADAEALVGWMKRLDTPSRKAIEARLRDATPGFTPTAAEREEHDLADWKALRALDPAIVTIGSHTLTHPILSRTSGADLESEVRDSRRQLEDRLQRPVDIFAYPNGDSDAASEACVRRHYRAALWADGGWVRRGADAHRLPRRAAPPGVLRLARRIYD